MRKSTYNTDNLTKQQLDCLSLIEALGIYELRAVARVFGDSSPTTIKRNDHINIIMDKIISGEDLKPLPVRQGRPYKELGNIEGILAELSQITGKDYSIKPAQPRNPGQKVVLFKQIEDDIVKQRLFPIVARGFLQEKNEREFFLINIDNGKIILVKKDMDSRLTAGDYVVGTAVIMNEEKEYLLESINSINYLPFYDYREINDEYQSTVPSTLLKLEEKDVVLGSRYLIETPKFTEKFDQIKKMVKILKENNIITVALIPNVMYEDVLSINSLGFNNAVIINYDERPTYTYDLVVAFIKHIKHIQDQGRNIAIFVEDICTIANSIDYAFKSNTKALMGHTEPSVEYVKQIMMLAKAGKNNKNTTIFTTFDQVDMFDPMYVSSIYKISKKLN